MDQIYETNDKFNFNELHITKPISSNGAFISGFSINEKPLYIQPPKCIVRQFITKNIKSMYCDLVFQQENEQFIRWIENLENRSQKEIYNNREKWFQTELEMDDIENSFTSPMKIYKSGRSYIIRTNIQNRLGKPVLKIYDEDEKDVPYDEMKDGIPVMVILEIKGIRCSTRSFKIEIELKQMMVLKQTDLFNTCILKKNPNSGPNSGPNLGPKSVDTITSNIISKNVIDNAHIHNNNLQEELEAKDANVNLGQMQSDMPDMSKTNITDSPVENNEKIKMDTSKNMNDMELCEVDFNLDEMKDSETVSIKQRNDVYYKMYHEARNKAKIARDLALSAYLEAKRIKNTYMLDDIVDSSDSEEEHDEDEDEDENENENEDESEE
jgi:hypothetical protein